MGIKHMSYLDIPLEKRKASADAMRKKLQLILANPFLTPEQTKDIHRQLDDVSKWETGELEVAPRVEEVAPSEPAAEAPRAPTHHSIAVVDDVKIEEN